MPSQCEERGRRVAALLCAPLVHPHLSGRTGRRTQHAPAAPPLPPPAAAAVHRIVSGHLPPTDVVNYMDVGKRPLPSQEDAGDVSDIDQATGKPRPDLGLATLA